MKIKDADTSLANVAQDFDLEEYDLLEVRL